MASLEFSPATPDSLLRALRDKFFYVQDLLDRHPTARKADDEQTLAFLSRPIRQRISPDAWETDTLNSFLLMACRLARAEVLSPSADASDDPCELADLICSAAVLGGDKVLPQARNQACGLWTMTRLWHPDANPSLSDIFTSAMTMLQPVGLTENELAEQVKIQGILYAGSRIEDVGQEISSQDIDTARQWCGELTNDSLIRLATRAINALGAQPPAPSSNGAVQSSDNVRENLPNPRFFEIPEILPQDQLQTLYEDCLMDLRWLAEEDECPLSPDTRSRVRSLRRDSDVTAFGAPFYFAAQNIWQTFVARGDYTNLPFARRLAQVLWSAGEPEPNTRQSTSQPPIDEFGGENDPPIVDWIVGILQTYPSAPYTLLGQELRSRHGDAARTWLAHTPLRRTMQMAAATGRVCLGGTPPQEYAHLPGSQPDPDVDPLRMVTNGPSSFNRDTSSRLSNTLHIWMCAQLPELIQTCPLSVILEDADLLGRRFDVNVQPARLRLALLEAAAGQCRAFERENSAAARQNLIEMQESHLQRTHQEFLESGVSQQNRERALEIWDYLFPRDRQEDDQDDASPGISQIPISTITQNPQYLQVIRAGDESALLDFIDGHQEEIRELLLNRLDTRLGRDQLICPDREVRTHNVGRRQPHPLFAEAVRYLGDEDWETASQILERLERTPMGGMAVQICQDFRAYALAKKGDLLGARMLLSPLTNAAFQSRAAYWNLACCLTTSPDSEKEQLDVLAEGLQAAPHPWLLHGAVALALLQDDERLYNWLPILTISEALLLSFHHEAEHLDRVSRDQVLLCLREYATRGEPAALDPADINKNLRFPEMRSLLQDLRYQPRTAEFWFICRRPMDRNNFGYWQLRSQFLEDENRTLEALQAYEEELRCRLYALGRNWTAGNLPHLLKPRAQYWLRKSIRSQIPEIQTVGQRIYNRLKDYNGEHRSQILPTDKEIIERYGTDERPTDEPLSTHLISTGVVCLEKLHEPKHLPRVSMELGQLVARFHQVDRPKAASALEALMKIWEEYANTQGTSTLEERRDALERAGNEFAKLQGATSHEFTAQERGAAANLLTVIHRVNDKLVSTLQLLPKIDIAPVAGETITVDDNAAQAAFSVRLLPPPDSMALHLTQATASLTGEGTEFLLRNQLDQIPVTLGANKNAILTFSLPKHFRIPPEASVRLEIKFLLAGEEYPQIFDPIPIASATCPELPESSPYIHGRALEPEEIDGHFFGRSEEQERVLRSFADNQNEMLYVEGIRRTGKSSLLNSIRREIVSRQLPLIPVLLDVSTVSAERSAGHLLHRLLADIVLEPAIKALGLTVPSQDLCHHSPEDAYRAFLNELEDKLPDHRVVAMVDDFQALVEAGEQGIQHRLPLAHGLTPMLNLLRSYRGPGTRLLWLFAGHRDKSEFLDMYPGTLLWTHLTPLRVDFLSLEAVRDIITVPLNGTRVIVPPETWERVHELTAGHPEIVQEMAERMLLEAKAESRWILTPADADAAAFETQYNDDKFADTWYPVRELTKEQRRLMGTFINAVKPGASIEPIRLFAGQQMTEEQHRALKGLIARNILESNGNAVRIKAYVLDLWLRQAWSRFEIVDTGSVAIFVDVPNLTQGHPEAVLTGLNTRSSDCGIPGRFNLDSILEHIERYASELSPVPVALRWAANYPPNSPALYVCHNKGYNLAKVPEDFHRKGNDDEVLKERIRQVEEQYPSVSHFVVVTGDKDFRVILDSRLVNGKHVHVISREASLADTYREMAQKYPSRFSFKVLEHLLEDPLSAVGDYAPAPVPM